MIIIDEQEALTLDTGEVLQKQDPDGPPPYSPAHSECSSTSTITPGRVVLSSSNTPQPPPPPSSFILPIPPVPADLVPSNFLSVRRKGDPIRSRYLLDLAIPPHTHKQYHDTSLSNDPAAQLAERDRRAHGNRLRGGNGDISIGESGLFGAGNDGRGRNPDGHRPNLKLRNTTGIIDTSVWVVNGSNPSSASALTLHSIDVKTTSGPIRLNINTDVNTDAGPTTFALRLRVRSSSGPVRLSIPCSYVGALSIVASKEPSRQHTSPALLMSPALEQRFHVLENVNVSGRRGRWRCSGYVEAALEVVDDTNTSETRSSSSSIVVESAGGPVLIRYVGEEHLRAESISQNGNASGSVEARTSRPGHGNRHGPRFWNRLRLTGGRK